MTCENEASTIFSATGLIFLKFRTTAFFTLYINTKFIGMQEN